MCACLTVLLGAMFPRLAILATWLFTSVVTRAFNGEWILPLLGVVLLPYTTLAYILMFWFTGSVSGFSWAFVVLGLFLDLGSYTTARQGSRTISK